MLQIYIFSKLKLRVILPSLRDSKRIQHVNHLPQPAVIAAVEVEDDAFAPLFYFCAAPDFVSTQRPKSQSRSDSRLRKITISAFGKSPASFNAHTLRSARRQTVRATSSVAEFSVAPGV